jgi:hypothetical protein
MPHNLATMGNTHNGSRDGLTLYFLLEKRVKALHKTSLQER